MNIKMKNMIIQIQKLQSKIKKLKRYYINNFCKIKEKIKFYSIIMMMILEMRKIMEENLKISIIINFSTKSKTILKIIKCNKTHKIKINNIKNQIKIN